MWDCTSPDLLPWAQSWPVLRRPGLIWKYFEVVRARELFAVYQEMILPWTDQSNVRLFPSSVSDLGFWSFDEVDDFARELGVKVQVVDVSCFVLLLGQLIKIGALEISQDIVLVFDMELCFCSKDSLELSYHCTTKNKHIPISKIYR